MLAEELLIKLAKKFGGKSFAAKDFEDEKLIEDAMNFAMDAYIMMPRQDEVKSLTCDGNNLYIAEYNPYMVLVAKAAVAANFGYSEYYGKRLTYIFVDNRFKSLSIDSQRAIIAHEIGHTMSNHTDHSIRTLKKENQADMYASSIVGTTSMTSALSQLGGDFISKLELKLRIHMLKKQAQR